MVLKSSKHNNSEIVIIDSHNWTSSQHISSRGYKQRVVSWSGTNNHITYPADVRGSPRQRIRGPENRSVCTRCHGNRIHIQSVLHLIEIGCHPPPSLSLSLSPSFHLSNYFNFVVINFIRENPIPCSRGLSSQIA